MKKFALIGAALVALSSVASAAEIRLPSAGNTDRETQAEQVQQAKGGTSNGGHSEGKGGNDQR